MDERHCLEHCSLRRSPLLRSKYLEQTSSDNIDERNGIAEADSIAVETYADEHDDARTYR